jgi:cytochrome c peroxidase
VTDASAGLAAGDRAGYLKLRCAIAGARGLWRQVSTRTVDVLVGPPRSADESGALGRLDDAMTSHDARREAEARQQLKAGFSVLRIEVDRLPPPSERATLQWLSDMAWEIGAEMLESTATTPDDEDAVLADLDGMLDSIADTAQALGGPSAAQVRTQCQALKTLAATLANRGAFVVETGRLGVAVRRFAAGLGHNLRPPYPAASDEISALTLPLPRQAPVPAVAALGRELFFDKRLSRGAARSCADCHQPAKAFTDGRPTPASLTHDPLKRNVPTLLYAALQASQLWDGRALTSAKQALTVIHTRAEMGLDDTELLAALSPYRARFSIFPDGLTAANVGEALAAYQNAELIPARAPVDKLARGEAPLDAEDAAGLDAFVAARCARCHIPPLFGGTRPTDFAVTVYSAIGVSRSPTDTRLDEDLGRGAVSGLPVDQHAFKTPTLRNIARTAPYFHNGTWPTLEEVVDFYDRGGGTGRGTVLANQDRDVRKLDLKPEQKQLLLRFMRHALSDNP